MFYRIKNEKIYDYADYEYANDCLRTDLCTMNEYINNPDKFIVAEVSENNLTVKRLILNPEWENIQKRNRETEFGHQFFQTSLGWIRRKVTMKDGSMKDFLSDLLLPIKAGLELGQAVQIITYKTPDFSKEPTSDYWKSLQEIKYATTAFIQECLMQTVKDFGLNNGGVNGISD